MNRPTTTHPGRQPVRRPAGMPPALSPTDPDALFRKYVRSAERARETRNIADGIAAGRAWRDFLTAFIPSDDGDDTEGAE